MKRRAFLISTLMATLPLLSDKKENLWSTLQDIQDHLFPGASKYNSINYLMVVSKDRSFYKKNLIFIFNGVKRLKNLGYKKSIKKRKKEKILQLFKKSSFGKNWISTILTYTIEAIFADPIYGGNRDKIGWRDFNHRAGYPRPKYRFGKRDV